MGPPISLERYIPDPSLKRQNPQAGRPTTPLHFPAPEQRPWLQIFPLNVQTESFLHRRRLSP